MHMIEDKIWTHYKYCYKIAKRIFKCHDQASDIASESIYKLLLALKSKNPPQIEDNPEPYINTIVFNICKNFKRKNSQYVQYDAFHHDVEYIIDHGMFDLEMLLERYPEETSKLIFMKVSGYSDKECAKEFNTNETTLKVRWHRLKKVLKSEFD